jgi:uncharacterized protein (TIGR00296 family)
MPFRLTHKEGKFLVKLARKAVEEYLKSGKTLRVIESASSKLKRECGVFVTINRIENGEKRLRGCIGHPYPDAPLIEAVVDSAISSAIRDPRFHPVSSDELDHILFELSILTPPEILKRDGPEDYPSKIRVGRDGLIVEKGIYKGLLLPQVPVEWKWDEEEFLCQCCIKAGLSPDCWLLKETKIYKFSSIIAKETTPNGPVKIIDMRKS